MERKKPPLGEMAQYKCVNTGMVVDVTMLLEEGRWYAEMWNDKAIFTVSETWGCPASPWCLELSNFGKHYKPVAPLPKLGGNKNAKSESSRTSTDRAG